MEECEPSCLTSPWRPPERRQADRRQGSDEWVTSPRWRLPVCSGLFGQSGGKIQNRAMRSECAHKAEHTAAQNHVKESARLRLTLGVLQHREAANKACAARKVQFVSIRKALGLKGRDCRQDKRCGNDCAAYFQKQQSALK